MSSLPSGISVCHETHINAGSFSSNPILGWIASDAAKGAIPHSDSEGHNLNLIQGETQPGHDAVSEGGDVAGSPMQSSTSQSESDKFVWLGWWLLLIKVLSVADDSAGIEKLTDHIGKEISTSKFCYLKIVWSPYFLTYSPSLNIHFSPRSPNWKRWKEQICFSSEQDAGTLR